MPLAKQLSTQRPPDYTSRQVKWRLFLGLAAVMLTLSLVERGFDADFRQWLSGAGPVEQARRFDNRLTAPQWRTASDPLGTFVAAEGGRSEVRDDTPVFRPAEQAEWFAAVAKVQAAEPIKATRVAYLQLYHQPAEYRGQFVTVKGTARLAYRVPALENELGVKEYFVYWIHPAGGPDSPLLVYALSAPPGFPIAAGPPQEGQQPRKMYEDVEVTGVFFKRAAYAAQGGTFTAPLIIAASPAWLRTDDAPARLPLSPAELAIAVLVALVFALCLTAVLWKRSRRPRGGLPAGGFPDLGALVLGPTPRERLKELEQQAHREGNSE